MRQKREGLLVILLIVGKGARNTAGLFFFCFSEGQRERERDGLFTQCVR